MGIFSRTKRTYLLFQAYQFGRDYYGVNLEKVMEPGRSLAIQQIQYYGDPIPQVIFFMFVPAFLGILDMSTRIALFDGMQMLFEKGHAHPDIYEDFMREWTHIDPNDPHQWVREALGG